MTSFLQIAPSLASMAVYMAPLPSILSVSKNQTTGDLPALTFVSMSVTCAIWGTYGGLRGDLTVLVPNAFGSLLSLYYLNVFETYTPKGVRTTELHRWYQIGILILTILLLQVTFGDVNSAISTVGTSAAILSVIFTASPLYALPAVIKSRSPDAIPFFTSLVLFSSSALWASYGFYIVDDRSIWAPNLFGAIASFLQIFVHFLFHFNLVPKPEGVKVASL